jgi:hypothetical protein
VIRDKQGHVYVNYSFHEECQEYCILLNRQGSIIVNTEKMLSASKIARTPTVSKENINDIKSMSKYMPLEDQEYFKKMLEIKL